jgi:cell shape-determining protein MreC
MADLSVWTALGITTEQIRALQQQLASFQAENTFLVHENSALQYKLSLYLGPEKEVKMPPNLSGKVLNVDPRFQFVVLNIGSDQGVAQGGKLLISRNGNLVGKLRVTSVEPQSSIANILADWKVADVREGDQVIHR